MSCLRWKAQIVKLLEEMRKVEQRSAAMAKELFTSKSMLMVDFELFLALG